VIKIANFFALRMNQEATESKTYEIQCGTLIKDNLLKIDALRDYLMSRIKVKGKTGRCEENVGIMCTADSVIVTPKVKLSKKYLKYLTNKLLYKMELKDWVRVISNGKRSYKMAYYKMESNKNE
jgi:large subunit ribosomal protein L22e